MSHSLTLLKINIKLLLRNKGFLFFLMVTPIVSVIILGLKTETSIRNKEYNEEINELKDASSKAIYCGNSQAFAFIVKVYDSSMTELSGYILEKLAHTGMFFVCRADTSKMTDEEILKQAEKDAFNDRAGTILYLKKDFEKGIAEGNIQKSLITYEVSGDKRFEIFTEALNAYLEQLHMLYSTGMDTKEVLEVTRTIQKRQPVKEIINISKKNDIVLDEEQSAAKDKIGYAFAIITLGFVFCGVCVAYTVIEEQENKVYTRIMLSGINMFEYLVVKFVMAIIISGMQTGVLGICMYARGELDFGIDKIVFLGIIFLLGLVFSVLSLCTGVLVGDIMSANYTVFTVWSISGLLAGVYFPLDNTSSTLKAVSFLMPQKWFIKASEMLLSGDKSAYTMLLCVTAAYLIIIASIGGVGLKIQHQEN